MEHLQIDAVTDRVDAGSPGIVSPGFHVVADNRIDRVVVRVKFIAFVRLAGAPIAAKERSPSPSRHLFANFRHAFEGHVEEDIDRPLADDVIERPGQWSRRKRYCEIRRRIFGHGQRLTVKCPTGLVVNDSDAGHGKTPLIDGVRQSAGGALNNV